MYNEYWQLASQPFGPAANTQFYYPSETHQGALLKLLYAIESGAAAALLFGRSGTGKSLLIHMLREKLPETAAPGVHLVFPRMSGQDMLVYLAEQLGAPPTEHPRFTVEESVRRLELLLTENSRQGRHAVIVIDEADLLDADVLEGQDPLEALRLLMNFEQDGQPCCTIVFVGQPSVLTAFSRRPNLEQRIGVKTMLSSFSVDESASYVQHRLQKAGATRTIFEDTALETIHALSQGVPRAINRLCDLALLIGYANGAATLSAEHIESVSNELLALSAA